MSDLLNITDADTREAAFAEIMRLARAGGFEGFGGGCYEAAVAINRTIFDGRGELVAGLNEFFADKGRFVGHAAVRFQGVCWDSDGRAKGEEEIEAWGMLDHMDGDWRDAALEYGCRLTERRANEAAIFAFESEADLLDQVGGGGGVPAMEGILQAALEEWRARLAAAPRRRSAR